MLADSGLSKLNKFYFDKENQPPSLYCDPAYPLRVLLEGSLKKSSCETNSRKDKLQQSHRSSANISGIGFMGIS